MTHRFTGPAGVPVQAPNDILFFLDVLDSASDCAFDRIARVASTSLGMPVVLIALADGDRQLFKSVIGLDPKDADGLQALCAHLGDEGDLTQMEDPCAGIEPIFLNDQQIRFFAGAAIRAPNGQRTGSLAVCDHVPRTLSPQQQRLLLDLASLAAHELEIRRVAATDPLTGAWNRRMLEQVAHNEFRRASRLARPFSLAVMDLDHFKAVNDRYGHDAGNDALRAFSRTFGAVMRAEDWLFRVGGEEFVAVLTGCTADDALKGVDRLRAAMAAQLIEASPEAFRVTISGAVIEAADSMGRPHGPLENLIREADMGLYAAKRRGRNRIIPVAPPRIL